MVPRNFRYPPEIDAASGEGRKRVQDEGQVQLTLEPERPVEAGADHPADDGHIDRGRMQVILLGAILVLLVVGFAFAARTLLLPIFLALFLSILFGPLMQRLRRWGIPEAIGAALVVFIIVSGCGAGVYYLAAPVQSWIERGPYIPYQTRQKIEILRKGAEAATKRVEELAKTGAAPSLAAPAGQQPKQPPEPPVSSIVQEAGAFLLGTATSTTITFFSLIVVLYFMLAGGRRTVEGVIRSLDSAQSARQMVGMVYEMNALIARYIQVISLINVGLGACTAGALALAGFPNALLWGFVVGLLNFLPFIGPFLSIALIGAVALLSFDSWLAIALPPVIVLVLQIVESHFVTPALVGRRLQLNPIAVILSILFWTWMWGLIGAILAVPILATMTIIWTQSELRHAFSRRLKSTPAEGGY